MNSEGTLLATASEKVRTLKKNDALIKKEMLIYST